MQHNSSNEEAEGDAEAATTSDVDSAEGGAGEFAGGSLNRMSDPSVASLPGFGGGGRSDPSVARLPEEVGGTDAGIGGDAFETGPAASVQREAESGGDGGSARAGDAGVPDVVRDVVSSPGRSLDTSIQRAMEDRMGDSFGDVRVHTGPRATAACQRLDARAFTVGNHVAFNDGEYDPGSPEGQHVIAHELAHVRQQSGGQVSMLPDDGAQLEVDPDPQLEREAEQAAQEAMSEGPVTVNRMGTDVAVQRIGGAIGDAVNSAKESLFGGGEEETSEVSVGSDPSIDQLAKKVQELDQRVEKMESGNSGAAEVLGDAVVGTATYAAGSMASSHLLPALGIGGAAASILGKGFVGGTLKGLAEKTGINDAVSGALDSVGSTLSGLLGDDEAEKERTGQTELKQFN